MDHRKNSQKLTQLDRDNIVLEHIINKCEFIAWRFFLARTRCNWCAIHYPCWSTFSLRFHSHLFSFRHLNLSIFSTFYFGKSYVHWTCNAKPKSVVVWSNCILCWAWQDEKWWYKRWLVFRFTIHCSTKYKTTIKLRKCSNLFLFFHFISFPTVSIRLPMGNIKSILYIELFYHFHSLILKKSLDFCWCIVFFPFVFDMVFVIWLSHTKHLSIIRIKITTTATGNVLGFLVLIH